MQAWIRDILWPNPAPGRVAHALMVDIISREYVRFVTFRISNGWRPHFGAQAPVCITSGLDNDVRFTNHAKYPFFFPRRRHATSEARPVRQDRVSTVRSRWSPYH